MIALISPRVLFRHSEMALFDVADKVIIPLDSSMEEMPTTQGRCQSLTPWKLDVDVEIRRA